MGYAEELLEVATKLVGDQPTEPSQAELRRGVSTAYYAVFHKFIEEASAHWSLDSSRDALSRMFEHGVMRKNSVKYADPRFPIHAVAAEGVVSTLRRIARSFVKLQDERKIADYDNAKFWTHVDASSLVRLAVEVLSDWQEIRGEKVAQDYLVAMLIRPRE